MTLEKFDRTTVHFWVPNVFEFKGGIQVYLNDILSAAEDLLEKSCLKNIHIFVINKLDKGRVKPPFDGTYFSFAFNGNSPKPLQTILFSFKLITASLFQKPDLILSGHLNFASVAYLIHKLLGIPYWILVYGVDAWDIKNPLSCKALRSAEKIISISGYTRDRLVSEQNLNSDKISLLPVTFDIDRFQIGSKPNYLLERHHLKHNQPIILTVARLDASERYKGYDQILRALPQILQVIPNACYVLVGKGNDRPRVEALVQELGLRDHTILTGFVPDNEIQDYYNLCDVFAMPSKGEGFGIVYLEALACGKPVVGGNQDGAIDALCHGELGILVDPDDLKAIAQVLIEILQGKADHPLIYQPEALRQKVAEIYGYEQFKANLAEIFQRFYPRSDSA